VEAAERRVDVPALVALGVAATERVRLRDGEDAAAPAARSVVGR